MDPKSLVKRWFEIWAEENFEDLPITDNFQHSSLFGVIKGKKEYIGLVEANREKFLGYQFIIRDQLYSKNSACVRYKAKQGDFNLDVSEWYYFENKLIKEVYAYYHIGEVRDNRKLK